MSDMNQLLTACSKRLDRAEGDVHTVDVTGALVGSWSEFDEFLDVREWALAWDALFEVGQRQHAPAAFWLELADAAGAMKYEAGVFKAKAMAVQASHQ